MNKQKLIGLIIVFLVGFIIGLISLLNAFFSSSKYEMMIFWLIISIVSFAIAFISAYKGNFLDSLMLP